MILIWLALVRLELASPPPPPTKLHDATNNAVFLDARFSALAFSLLILVPSSPLLFPLCFYSFCFFVFFYSIMNSLQQRTAAAAADRPASVFVCVVTFVCSCLCLSLSLCLLVCCLFVCCCVLPSALLSVAAVIRLCTAANLFRKIRYTLSSAGGGGGSLHWARVWNHKLVLLEGIRKTKSVDIR